MNYNNNTYNTNALTQKNVDDSASNEQVSGKNKGNEIHEADETFSSMPIKSKRKYTDIDNSSNSRV